jgi:hypothetical protein
MDKLPFGLHENVGRKKKKNREKTKQHKCPFSEILKLWILQISFRKK